LVLLVLSAEWREETGKTGTDENRVSPCLFPTLPFIPNKNLDNSLLATSTDRSQTLSHSVYSPIISTPRSNSTISRLPPISSLSLPCESTLPKLHISQNDHFLGSTTRSQLGRRNQSSPILCRSRLEYD